ncbi:MAG: S8 family serine peptidase, partial [Candidatus Competibacteraceae bacterium]|nr:S8 family serine peptidase [Candidatus Competibacteraceae bacterium]
SDIRYPRSVDDGLKTLTALAPQGIWDAQSVSSFSSNLVHHEDNPEKLEFMARLANRICQVPDSAQDGNISGKAIPLPKFMRDPVTKVVTSLFIKDVAAYFYNVEERAAIKDRLVQCLKSGHDGHLLVTHSLGTVIAYDVLSDHASHNLNIPLWVTLGSPLGIQEVQDRLKALRPGESFRRPPAVKSWLNFADRLDAVAIDPTVRDDFSPAKSPDHTIVDKLVENPDRADFTQYGPHSAKGYLSIPMVRGSVIEVARAEAGDDYLNELSSFLIAKDVAYMINRSATTRIPVLIELNEKTAGGDLNQKRTNLIKTLEQVTGGNPDAEIDEMVRFVSASLTAPEVDQLNMLATEKVGPGTDRKLTISRIWSNGEKRALVNAAATTVHASVARLGYNATGKGIGWAVLDSGVESAHPHFASHENIVSVYDCTGKGVHPLAPTGALEDPNGHGTHVCGIIAGRGNEKNGAEELCGIAPETKLHVYKVLKDNGAGRDCFSIKALDHIASINESSSKLVIHGINLSLGGPADSTVFAPGHAPLCRELRRLWRQGVVIVVAAGNEGLTTVMSKNGFYSMSTSLAISDPANLEECIAVGSIHKSSPHFLDHHISPLAVRRLMAG